MDRLLPNLTGGANDSTPGQNCLLESSVLLLDKALITTPSWGSVNQDLRWLFLLHTYAFACLFFVLSFYSFFSFLNLRSLISSPPLMSTINIFLCLLGASRSGCLFIDPYNLKEIMPKVIGSIMWDIGFPFITSAFCLIQLAFLQLTQVKFGLERFQRETYLSLVIIFHFSCVIISDVSLAFHISYMAKYVVQAAFLLWALALYVIFLYAGYKVKILLKTLPTNLLVRDNSTANQKGIMQLAMLAPYNNLATSVAAALVPTLLGQKLKALEEGEPAKGPDTNPSLNSNQRAGSLKSRVQQENEKNSRTVMTSPPEEKFSQQQPISTVPEVYVRPPTPTPSIINLPTITVSSPSRRSSLASRRGSDASRCSRRASECSVRFVNEEDNSGEPPESPGGRRSSGVGGISPRHSPLLDRSRSPEGILRRNSDCPSITPTGSSRDVRRGSDFGNQEKTRSQFATKLRRNSDFGNRTPKRQVDQEQSRLSKILDVSPTGSRRNSDLGGLVPTRVTESRRNSDISCRRSSVERRGSELVARVKPLVINRRSSDVSIRTLDMSPTHYSQQEKQQQQQQQQQQEMKSESDSDQPDNYYGNEKAALMNNKDTDDEKKDEEEKEKGSKSRKKNLSWKSDKVKDDQEDITAETSLLPEMQQASRVAGTDFTLHSILNHIAYVNRAKSDTPLHISEASTAAARRAQIKRVLNVTYATAVFGILLCLADAGRIFGPYGLLAEVVKYGTKPTAGQYPKPWPWIIYQTVCRSLELIMGCAMASITKQPSTSPRHQYLSKYPDYSLRMKQRNNLYI